jgi:type IV secretory pathway VirB2 component (pilin)
MKARWIALRRSRHSTRVVLAFLVALLLATSAFAQANANSPWENAVGVLQQAFTSTIARGLSLVAIVVSGLTFAFERSKPTSVIPYKSSRRFRSPGNPRLRSRPG